MVFLIVLFAVLLLLLLLAMPIIVSIHARFSPAGGVVRAKAYLFGVLPIPLRLTVRLLSEPYLTVRVFGRERPLLSPKKTPMQRPDPCAIRLERIDAVLTLGISDDPAATVRVLGTLDVLLSLLLSELAPRVRIRPCPSFSAPMLRINAHVLGLVFPLFLLTMAKKRITGRKPANHKDTIKQEKRYSHAPC